MADDRRERRRRPASPRPPPAAAPRARPSAPFDDVEAHREHRGRARRSSAAHSPRRRCRCRRGADRCRAAAPAGTRTAPNRRDTRARTASDLFHVSSLTSIVSLDTCGHGSADRRCARCDVRRPLGDSTALKQCNRVDRASCRTHRSDAPSSRSRGRSPPASRTRASVRCGRVRRASRARCRTTRAGRSTSRSSASHLDAARRSTPAHSTRGGPFGGNTPTPGDGHVERRDGERRRQRGGDGASRRGVVHLADEAHA